VPGGADRQELGEALDDAHDRGLRQHPRIHFDIPSCCQGSPATARMIAAALSASARI
jgi:hypothetical protein